jgi:hypothetical protein
VAIASETDDPANAAERLEAALERIARAATREPVPLPIVEHAAIPADELAARLDALIHRLRTALSGASV